MGIPFQQQLRPPQTSRYLTSNSRLENLHPSKWSRLQSSTMRSMPSTTPRSPESDKFWSVLPPRSSSSSSVSCKSTVTLASSRRSMTTDPARYNVRLGDLEKWVVKLLPSRQFGYIVLTTSAGIMDHEEARRKHVAGKIIGFFY